MTAISFKLSLLEARQHCTGMEHVEVNMTASAGQKTCASCYGRCHVIHMHSRQMLNTRNSSSTWVLEADSCEIYRYLLMFIERVYLQVHAGLLCCM